MKKKEWKPLTSDEFEFRVLSGGEVEITGYTGKKEALVAVPDLISDGMHDSYRVTVIGSRAFAYHTEIKRLHLPRTLREIGAEAFWACSELEWMKVPDSVTIIGDNAFGGCGRLCLTSGENAYAKKAAELAGISWKCAAVKGDILADDKMMEMEGDYMTEIERGGYMPEMEETYMSEQEKAYMPEIEDTCQPETGCRHETQPEEENTTREKAHWPSFEELFGDEETPFCRYTPEGRRRRMRRVIRKGKCALLACAAAVLVFAALIHLSSGYRLVKICDQEEVEYAVHMIEECGDALMRMTDQLQMYTGLVCGDDLVIPLRERTQMVGEMRYDSDLVEELSARARMALVRMGRSGSVLRATGKSVDLNDVCALLDALERGAQRLYGYARVAADMMAEGELWKQHGKNVIACLNDMAVATDELAVCGQAALYRRFMSADQLLDGSWGGDVCVMLVNMSESEVNERGLRLLSVLAGMQSRMDMYQALVEAERTKAMENIG